MSRFFGRRLWVLALFWAGISPGATAFADASADPAAGEKNGTPIQVHGDSVEYFHEAQKAVGTGHVLIDYEDVQLSADKITVYMQNKTAVAEGHVVLTQKGSVFKGEKAEYDFRSKVGNVTGMDATIPPSYYGKAKRIEKVSENHYRAVDSYVTTCCGDSPFYKIQAHEIDIYPDDKVIIRHALLYIQGVPVLYLPYYVQYLIDFDRFPVQLVPGKNRQWGAFLLSKWRYNLVRTPEVESKGNILFDWRERRGFGGGVENFYRGSKVGRGAARLYYADDDKPSEVNIDSERTRVQWRHQSQLTDDTTLTTEINQLSDALVIKDFFFREEYEKDAFPDNYISLITAKPEYTLSVLERHRLDNFFTVVERNPEVRFDTHNRQFAETPFYLREEIQFSNLSRKNGESDSELDALRLDTNHTLSYAGRVGFVSVTPRVGTRQTFYSRQLEGDKELVRGTFDPGLDLSTRFYRIYDFYTKTWGLDINQIRHIFSPTASYNYRPTPTVSRTRLQQFDALDAIDKQNLIRFGFENKFQTKEHTEGELLRPRELARVFPFLDTDLHTGRLQNVGLDVELRPYSWLGMEADANYNPDTRDIDTANFDVYFTRGPWNVAVGQRYVQNESSQMTAQVRFKLNEEWEFKLYDRYEFEEGLSKEFEATVSKTFECVIADFTYNHRDEGGDTFYFLFRLKAFPSASFSLSQSYNHPKSSPENVTAP